MPRESHSRTQGDLGEAAAIEWLARQGFGVLVPLFHSPDYDLVADTGGGRLIRVQVKTSACWQRKRFVVQLSTRGGNRSWTGVVKRFDSSRCDYLFVLVGDRRRWFIPAKAIGAGTAICLGGPKYAEYEVDRNENTVDPVLDFTAAGGAPELESRTSL